MRVRSADPSVPPGTRLLVISSFVVVGISAALIVTYGVHSADILSPSGGRWRFYWPAWFRSAFRTAALLSVGALYVVQRLWMRGQRLAAFAWLSPLWLLFAAFRESWGRSVTANGLFFYPLVVATLLVAEIYRRSQGRLRVRGGTLFITFALFYFCTGMRFTKTAGPHSGDEGHYMIQAESLYRDHDLDIKNNLAELLHRRPEDISRPRLHISSFSRGDHWYSLHAAGLPLLLSPLVPLGDSGRHAVLAVISAVSILLAWILCRRAGVEDTAAAITLILFGTSFYWTVYSSRCLPEVLGATLTLAVIVAAKSFQRHPAVSVAAAALCGGFLPWTNIRFVPVAIAAQLVFAASVVAERSLSLRTRLKRLAVFLFFAAAGWLVYASGQYAMFEGGLSHPVTNILMSQPSGMWYVLAGVRGILSVLPSFACLLAANILGMADRRLRYMSTVALFLLAVVLVTTCTSRLYTGGATVPGRFLAVTVPLFLPATAWVFQRTGTWGRRWIIFLGLISCAFNLLTLVKLPQMGRQFTLPVGSLTAVVPLLRGLLQPFCYFALERMSGIQRIAGSAFAALLLLGSLLILRGCWRRAPALLPGIVAVAAVLSHATIQVPDYDKMEYRRANRVDVARQLARIPLDDCLIIKSQGIRTAAVIFEESDALAYIGHRVGWPIVSAVDTEPGPGVILVRDLPPNDWAGRGFRWATLAAPFHAGEGWRVFRIRGWYRGGCPPVLALREGSDLIYEGGVLRDSSGAFETSLAFRCRGGGRRFYILLRVDAGVATVTEMNWSPWSPRFLKAVGLVLPPGTVCLWPEGGS